MTARVNQGMPRYLRSKSHQIDEDELLSWLRDEHWETFASSTREPKRLSVLVNGSAFLVTHGDTVVYRGQNASDAVRSYNEVQ